MAVGETAGTVGTTGAVVSAGIVAIGAAVAVGDALTVGFAEGAIVGVVMLPPAWQAQPARRISIASSGMKKNRFIMRISFRFFSDSVSDTAGVMRLRRKKKYAILRT